MEQDSYPKIYLYKRIVQAKLFIDNNFCAVINLDDVAGEASFSRFHFLRLFKNAYGKTPHQYLTYKRIEHARQLLKNGSSISDVCYHCGFESLGSFSALFKKVVGLTPTAYQFQQQQASAAMHSSPIHFVPGCFARAILG